MKQLTVLFALVLSLAVQGCINFNSVNLWPQDQPLGEYTIGGDEDADAKVLVVDVSGIILDTEQKGLLGLTGMENTAAKVRAALRKADEDRDIAAVIIRINSPGGTVTASDLIHYEIRSFRNRHPHIPVHAMMLDLAASGGYYVAVSTEKIWAHPTTVTGSIGVIVQGVNLSGLFDKIGIEDQTIKSGKHKDMMSPLRPQDDSDRKLMQGVVDSLYEQFLARVMAGRPEAKEERLREIADGRVYTAQTAKEEKLIDEIGYFDDVVEGLRQQTGRKSLRVVTYRNRVIHDDNIYAQARQSTISEATLGHWASMLLSGQVSGGSPFLYYWAPGIAR